MKISHLLAIFTLFLTSSSLFMGIIDTAVAEWVGTDEKAKQAINEIDPHYKPWFSPIWEPPSGEIESFLFSLQAAIGSLLVGYFIGYYKGKNSSADGRVKGEDENRDGDYENRVF